MKYKFLNILVLMTLVYLIYRSLNDFIMVTEMFGDQWYMDSSQNYFLTSVVRLFFSQIIFIWCIKSLYLFYIKSKDFVNTFINVCVLFGFELSLLIPAINFKRLDPNYFNYFAFQSTSALYEVFVTSFSIFLIAWFVGKHYEIKDENL